jgi:hypothetical protein
LMEPATGLKSSKKDSPTLLIKHERISSLKAMEELKNIIKSQRTSKGT